MIGVNSLTSMARRRAPAAAQASAHVLAATDPQTIASLSRTMRFLHARKAFAGNRRSSLTIRRTQSLGSNVGDHAMIWVNNFAIGTSGGTYVQVAATLKAVTAHGYIWVADSLTALQTNATSINTLANDFENGYTSDVAHFASPLYDNAGLFVTQQFEACDTTGTRTGSVNAYVNSDKINVFFTDPATLGSGVGGYFDAINFISQSAIDCDGPSRAAGVHSNEAPIIYAGYFTKNGSYFELTEDMVRDTAHELQHLINFVQHSIVSGATTSDDTYINEGQSMLAQDFAASQLYSIPNDYVSMVEAQQYLQAPQNFSVTGFSGMDQGKSATFNCSACYGGAYLFARYLYDRFGGDAYLHAIETSSSTGIAHVVAVTGVGQPQLISDFAVALEATNTLRTTDPRFNFTGINLRTTIPTQLNGGSVTFDGPAALQSMTSGSSTVSSVYGELFYVDVPAAGATITVSTTDPVFGLNAGIVQR